MTTGRAKRYSTLAAIGFVTMVLFPGTASANGGGGGGNGGGGGGGTVLPPPPAGVFVDPSFLDPIDVGQQHIADFVTVDGTLESYSLSVVSGALPPGMTLAAFAPLTSVFSGVPTTVGSFTFTVRFSGSAGDAFGLTYTWQVDPPAPLHITQANVGPGTVGQPYDGGFFYGGGVPPWSWSVVAGALPPGLRMNSQTSEISGTPTTAGTYTFTAQLADSQHATLRTQLSITIS
jgi:hypothetical protein